MITTVQIQAPTRGEINPAEVAESPRVWLISRFYCALPRSRDFIKPIRNGKLIIPPTMPRLFFFLLFFFFLFFADGWFFAPKGFSRFELDVCSKLARSLLILNNFSPALLSTIDETRSYGYCAQESDNEPKGKRLYCNRCDPQRECRRNRSRACGTWMARRRLSTATTWRIERN